MMLKFSFHNHTTYSDGLNSPEEMITAAIDAGFTHYAFTDHLYNECGADWTLDYKLYDQYIAHINKIKKEYKGTIKVYAGAEADWYKSKGTHTSRYGDIKGLLDMTVGSVHLLNPRGEYYEVDGNREEYRICLEKGFGGNIRQMVTFYYESYMEMAETLKPELMGHIDIIRINNQEQEFFDEDEPWYIDLIERTARTLKKHDLVTEINGGGNYRRNNGIVYPSQSFLRVLRDAEVRITIGLDAHSADMVTNYYDLSVEYAKQAGYDELYYYEDSEWRACKI